MRHRSRSAPQVLGLIWVWVDPLQRQLDAFEVETPACRRRRAPVPQLQRQLDAFEVETCGCLERRRGPTLLQRQLDAFEVET